MIRTKYGIHIPPKKRQTFKKNITLEFLLAGWIPSKKNMQFPSFNFSWARSQIYTFFKANNNITPAQFMKFALSLLRSIKPYIMNPKKYTDWEEKSKEELLLQAQDWRKRYEKHGLAFPITKCSIKIYYFWSDRRRRDNSNKSEAIHDLLVKAGIILDDSDECLYKNSAEAFRCHGEILTHTTQIFLTAHEWIDVN